MSKIIDERLRFVFARTSGELRVSARTKGYNPLLVLNFVRELNFRPTSRSGTTAVGSNPSQFARFAHRRIRTGAFAALVATCQIILGTANIQLPLRKRGFTLVLPAIAAVFRKESYRNYTRETLSPNYSLIGGGTACRYDNVGL